jgi:hypothetical protein
MRKRSLFNSSEFKTLEMLEKSLINSGCVVRCMVRINAVIEQDGRDRLSKDLQRMLDTGEFDFVIYNDKRSDVPLFVVEFDGPVHRHFEKRIRADIRKNRLCHLAELPLIRISDAELDDYNKMTILEYIIYRYLAWKREESGIRDEIQEYLSLLSDNQKKELFDGGFADPCVDPSVIFDLRHPFPKTMDVVKRLLINHGIVTLRAEGLVKREMKHKNYYFFADDFPKEQTFEGHDLIVKVDWVVSKYKTQFAGEIKTIASAQDRYNSIVVKHGTITLRVRSTHPIVYDYDSSKETPIDYYMRKQEFPISFQELPGISAHSIAENMSEYLCLKEMEKWAAVELLNG